MIVNIVCNTTIKNHFIETNYNYHEFLYLDSGKQLTKDNETSIDILIYLILHHVIFMIKLQKLLKLNITKKID